MSNSKARKRIDNLIKTGYSRQEVFNQLAEEKIESKHNLSNLLSGSPALATRSKYKAFNIVLLVLLILLATPSVLTILVWAFGLNPNVSYFRELIRLILFVFMIYHVAKYRISYYRGWGILMVIGLFFMVISNLTSLARIDILLDIVLDASVLTLFFYLYKKLYSKPKIKASKKTLPNGKVKVHHTYFFQDEKRSSEALDGML